MWHLKVSVLLVAVLCSGCQNEPPVPKPRTFPRIIYPERIIRTVSPDDCPFSFEFAEYGQINSGKSFFGEEPPHPCWFDIEMSAFNANLYMSYYPVDGENSFQKLVGDTYKILTQINKRSDYMEEVRLSNQHGTSGMKFTFEGAAASPIHFYLSDTTTHFVKGALYYNHKVRPDSLAPATEFILEDIHRMLSTFQWQTDSAES